MDVPDAMFVALEDSDELNSSEAPVGVAGKKANRARPRSGAKQPAPRKKGRTADAIVGQDPKPVHALNLIKASLDANTKASAPHIVALGPQLHCNLCGKTFGTRKNVWQDHLKSQKHVQLLCGNGPQRRPVAQATLSQFIGAEAVANRELVKVETQHRTRVMRTVVLGSNVAVSSIKDDFKELLEEERRVRISLGDMSNLARQTLLTVLHELDTQDAAAVALGGSHYSLFFDGYSEKDEHSIVIVRVCSKDFQLVERVVSVRLWAGSLSGQVWARIVDEVRRRLGPRGLVYTLADGHPSNGIVGTTFAALQDNYVHLFCTSHTLAVAGNKTNAALVMQFVILWNNTFKNSPSARELVKEKMGEDVKRKAKVRWFSVFEVVEQAMRWYPRLFEIADAIDRAGFCSESVAVLKTFLRANGMGPTTSFAVQLAAFCDINKHLRDACYFLEGSGYLSPFWLVRMELIRNVFKKVQSIDTSHTVMPNVAGLIHANQNTAAFNKQTVWGIARQVVDPVCTYFLDHFIEFKHDTPTRPFRKAFELFSFARIFHPIYAKKQINGKDFKLERLLNVDVVKGVLGALGPSVLANLTTDFALFLSVLETKVDATKKYHPDDLLVWWKEHGKDCGAWASAAQLFALFQPSSASAERGFSMLRASVGPQQQRTLEDMVEARLRQRYSIKDTSAGVE